MKKLVIVFLFLVVVIGNFTFVRAEKKGLSPKDLVYLAESLKSLQQELEKIKNDIENEEKYLDGLIELIRICKVKPGDSMINNLANKVKELKARLDGFKKKILTGKEPNITDMMKAVGERLSEVTNDLSNKERALESVRYEMGQVEDRRNTINKQIEEARVRFFPQDEAKIREFNELTQKLEDLEFEKRNLQAEIDKLKTQKEALSSVLDLYNKILSDMADLQIEIMKLDRKIELIKKLKPIKDNLEEEKNPEKRKELIKKMYEEIKGLDNSKNELDKIINSGMSKKIMEATEEKAKKAAKKLKEFEKKLKKIVSGSLPGAPPSVPRHWGIGVSGFYRWINMSDLNNYIKWINATYDGNIEEFSSTLGGSLAIFYQINRTLSIGVLYEYMKASTDGTLTITDPPATYTHKQSLSASGLFGMVRMDIPLNISRLALRAIGGAGLYFGNYHESENGFDVKGTGTGFGYTAGLGLHYEFADGFESGTTMSWTGGSINQFEDNAGNTLQYISTYKSNEDVTANLSGFSVSLNFTVKF